ILSRPCGCWNCGTAGRRFTIAFAHRIMPCRLDCRNAALVRTHRRSLRPMSTPATPDIPLDSSQEIVVRPDDLHALMVKILVKKGMFQAEAKIAAFRLLESDIRGIHSHGSRALPRYIEGMDQGDIDPRAQVLTIKETPAIAVLDGGKGLGHVAATKGMQL